MDKIETLKKEFAEYLGEPGFFDRYNALQDQCQEEIDELGDLKPSAAYELSPELVDLKMLFIFIQMMGTGKSTQEVCVAVGMPVEKLEVLYAMVSAGWEEFKRRYANETVTIH